MVGRRLDGDDVAGRSDGLQGQKKRFLTPIVYRNVLGLVI